MTDKKLSVLLIEDSDQLAGATARELEQDYGHTVSWLPDPTGMELKLSEQQFDVAIIDLLYEHLNLEFNAKRLARGVQVREERLLITGLTAIHLLREHYPWIGIVVWTSGEANRRLHLLYSYQDLAMRNFCSKSPGTGRANTLAHAARMAHAHRPYVDPVLNPYLPPDNTRWASHILLHDHCKRAIWRALAIGAATRQEIARITGYATRTIGNRIPEMYQELREFDAGLITKNTPLIEVALYASNNWQFFLDDAVRVMYP
jgi:DNA-binding NarL/FixJ family response regulator